MRPCKVTCKCKLDEFRETPEVDNSEPSFKVKTLLKVQRLGIETTNVEYNILTSVQQPSKSARLMI
jgi:hypothetical protein